MARFLPNLDLIIKECKSTNNLEPLLPILLWLNGKPYNLDDYYVFKPIFRIQSPHKIVLKSGRQVGKSTSLAALSIIRSIAIPYHKIMFITPLRDQARNISDSYVKNFLVGSPIGRYFINDNRTKSSTFYKEFATHSRIAFRYAQISADRIRSYSNDVIIIDELQNFDHDFLPIVESTMSASTWRLKYFAGTPLDFENSLQYEWEDTCQYEWGIKCTHCGYWNIACIEEDLEKMIGPFREDISEEKPATICAKCAKIIYPRTGQWIAKRKELVNYSEGYHIPQIIMPLHYADVSRWYELLEKKQKWQRQKFYNEVLGEACDEGIVLVREEDIKKAGALEDFSIDFCLWKKETNQYSTTILAIDWGGGGETTESYTCIAFLGLTPFGVIEVPWAIKFVNVCDPFEEANEICRYYQMLNPDFIVHDYTGGIGNLRENILVDKGISVTSIVPVYIQGSTTNYVVTVVDIPSRARKHYRIDKTKAMQIVVGAMRAGFLKFFSYQKDYNQQKLLHDFLNIIEERKVTVGGRETYRITKKKKTSDDFAMTTMIGSCILWYMFEAWPVFS